MRMNCLPALRFVPLLLLVLLLCWIISCSAETGKSTLTQTGLIIEVDPLGHERFDKPVEVMIDVTTLMGDHTPDTAFNQESLTLQEIGYDRKVIDHTVPFQIDCLSCDISNTDVNHELVFILKGLTPVHRKRIYLLSSDSTAVSTTHDLSPYITITDNVYHEEQNSYLIETQNAAYYYHKLGAGFASMEDCDGNDWLGYRPGGKSAGEYRGIPNMGYPEGYCHPGKTESNSRILKSGPITIQIYSESNDGNWSCMWDIFPHYARMTVLKTSHPYWFLYEGTPGGSLDEDSDYCVRPSGKVSIRTLLGEKWQGDISVPSGDGEWIYFGDGDRILYLVHHNDDDATDSYWPMNGDMTVFGFGRLNLNKYMTELPAQFTIGFSDLPEQKDIEKTINGAYQPLEITFTPLY